MTLAPAAIGRRRSVVSCLVALAAAAFSCGGPDATGGSERERLAATPSRGARPNVLWIVWDTVRADRLTPWSGDRRVTPFLDSWARGARLYEDARSVAPTTVAAHASMFTGLLPPQHGADNRHDRLDPAFETLAERLADSGYATFAYAANPFVRADTGLTRGFEVERHPWDDDLRPRALDLLAPLARELGEGSRLGRKIEAGDLGRWGFQATGTLAGETLLAWLRAKDRDRPYLAFLNYMEAHAPLIPRRAARERVMDPVSVDASYAVDRSWPRLWGYTFRLTEFTPRELALTRATYDAALRELDDHLATLMQALDAEGFLDDTIVVLTSDHGEHLGENHRLEHQYSLFTPLLHVPLVIRVPPAFAPPGWRPGREARPVTTAELYATLLAWTGAGPPAAGAVTDRLDRTRRDRDRLAFYPNAARPPFRVVRQRWPAFDPEPWQSPIRAIARGPWVWIEGGYEGARLVHRTRDPAEETDFTSQAPRVRDDLARRLERAASSLASWRTRRIGSPSGGRGATEDETVRSLLESLGYSAGRSGADPDD